MRPKFALDLMQHEAVCSNLKKGFLVTGRAFRIGWVLWVASRGLFRASGTIRTGPTYAQPAGPFNSSGLIIRCATLLSELEGAKSEEARAEGSRIEANEVRLGDKPLEIIANKEGGMERIQWKLRRM